MNGFPVRCVNFSAMARLRVQTPGFELNDVLLKPGCNRVGREGDVDILLPHPSVSRRHCELWLEEDAVLARDLESRNGTFVNGDRITEAQILEGQVLRVGDVELRLVEAPAHISVPEVPLPPQPKQQLFFDDGTPSCFRHNALTAIFQCNQCSRAFCGQCVRELRIAGGMPRRFCPECGGQCERIGPAAAAKKRPSWLDKIVRAFTQPPRH